MSYRGKTAVVTGAASGMGRATASLLVHAGADVIALDRQLVDLEGARFLEIDLADPDAIATALGELPSSVDTLFNCAGVPQTFGPDTIIRVNILGLRELTEGLIPRMPSGGTIANIASTGGLNWPSHRETIVELIETEDFAAGLEWCARHEDVVREGYAFSKECVIVYTMWRSAALLQAGIRINCTSPGMTVTGMTGEFQKWFGDEYWQSVPRPGAREAVPEEQARPLLFLNSDEASYVAGANLIVDGGLYPGVVNNQFKMPAQSAMSTLGG